MILDRSKILICYNTDGAYSANSQDVAKYYGARRGIERVVGFSFGTASEISNADYVASFRPGALTQIRDYINTYGIQGVVLSINIPKQAVFWVGGDTSWKNRVSLCKAISFADRLIAAVFYPQIGTCRNTIPWSSDGNNTGGYYKFERVMPVDSNLRTTPLNGNRVYDWRNAGEYDGYGPNIPCGRLGWWEGGMNDDVTLAKRCVDDALWAENYLDPRTMPFLFGFSDRSGSGDVNQSAVSQGTIYDCHRQIAPKLKPENIHTYDGNYNNHPNSKYAAPSATYEWKQPPITIANTKTFADGLQTPPIDVWGWVGTGLENINDVWTPSVNFKRGAWMYEPTSTFVSQYCLRDGGCAAIGPTDEPYTNGVSHPASLIELLLRGYSMMEAEYCSIRLNTLPSFMEETKMEVWGDPLYSPLKTFYWPAVGRRTRKIAPSQFTPAVPQSGALVVNSAATGAPSITGALFVGQTLTATIGTLADDNGLPAVFPTNYNLQWKRGGANISNATAGTYVLAAADYNQTITVTASFTDGARFPESRTSAPTTAIGDNVAPSVTAFVVASPTNTLTASITTFNDTDNVGVTHWMATTDQTTPLQSDIRWVTSKPTTVLLQEYNLLTACLAYVKDAAGNINSVPGVSQVTALDTELPTGGVITATAVGQTQVNIAVTTPASDNVRVDHYTLDWAPTSGGSWTPLSTNWNGTTYQHTGRVQATPYYYRVKAVDPSGNASAAYLTGNATTQSVVVAPTWGNFVLPSLNVGQGYGALDLDTKITSNGGDAAIIYSILSGALPTSITLNSNGTFSNVSNSISSGTVTFGAVNSANPGSPVSSGPIGWIVNSAGWVDVYDTFTGADVVIAGTATEDASQLVWSGDAEWVTVSGRALCTTIDKRITLNIGQNNYTLWLKDVQVPDLVNNSNRLLVYVRYVNSTTSAYVQLRNSAANGDLLQVYNSIGGASAEVVLSGLTFPTGRNVKISISSDHYLRAWEVNAIGDPISSEAVILITNPALLTSTVFALGTFNGAPNPSNVSIGEVYVDDPPAVLDITPPTAPTNFVADAIGANQNIEVHVTFTISNDPESGVARYELVNNGTTIIDSNVASNDIVTLPYSGTTYNLTIVAVNGVGLKTSSSPSVQYITTGSAPTVYNYYRKAQFAAGLDGASSFADQGSPPAPALDGWDTGLNGHQPAQYDICGGPGEPPAPYSGAYCSKMIAIPPAVPDPNPSTGTTSNWGGFIEKDRNGLPLQFNEGDESWHRIMIWIPSAFVFYCTDPSVKWTHIDVDPNPYGRIHWKVRNNGDGTLFNSKEITDYTAGADEYYANQTAVAIPRNQWVAFETYNKWSSDINTAKVRCYINKQLVHESTTGNYVNLPSGTTALAFGFCTNYNPPGLADTTPVWVDEILIGKNNTPFETGSDGKPILGYYIP